MKREIKHKEFIVLMALLMSLIALAIDAMLPAISVIGKDLNAKGANDSQLIISSIFLGVSFGLMIFGPLSDSYGRKFAISLGVLIFIFGCLVSFYAPTFEVMIIGRIIQGFGGAASRVVTVAIVKDMYSGRKMAQVISLMMIIFILIPVLSPSVGLFIMHFTHWSYIFLFMMALSLFGLIWFMMRQPETLPKEKRSEFSFSKIWSNVKEAFSYSSTLSYTIAAGLVFGAFIGYLNTSQQILGIQYELGDKFSLLFGVFALGIGLASFVNSRLVMTFGMRNLCIKSLCSIVTLAAIFIAITYLYEGHPPLGLFISYMMMTLFCFGILFGNFNTLAIEPLGHIAGTANSLISSLQTFISLIIGSSIGQMYDGSIFPIIIGFFTCGIISLLVVLNVNTSKQNLKTA